MKRKPQEALDLIKVNYQVLPFVLDPEEALKPEAPKIHPQGNILGGKPDQVSAAISKRDFKEADLIYKNRYRTSMLQHATGESAACVAQWQNGKLTVWDSTPVYLWCSEGVGQGSKIPMSKVRVICDYMGGRFRRSIRRLKRYNVLAALLTRKTGRPVKIQFKREENFLAGHHRYPTIWHLKYGVKERWDSDCPVRKGDRRYGRLSPFCRAPGTSSKR